MSCELSAVSHSPAQTVNKQPPEAQTKYSCLDVALGRTGDDCTRYIMIAAAILSLGATIVGAGIVDAISAAWSWATGPSANAEEIVVIPTIVDEELPATDKPVAAVITEVTDEPVSVVAMPVKAKDPETVEAPKDDSYRATRFLKSSTSSIKHYSGAAVIKTRDAALATPSYINSHRKETAGTVTALAMAYLGYQYSGTVLSASWSQAPSWQGTKDNAEWVKNNTWGRMLNTTNTP